MLVLLVACGAELVTGTPPAPPRETGTPTRRPVIIPTTPAGWTPYSRSTFQIALPDTWKEVKADEQELRAAIASAQENNPPLADPLRTLLESGQYRAFVFYAIDSKGVTEASNVSVARIDLEGTNDLAGFARAYANTLPNTLRGSRVSEVQTSLRVNGIEAAAIVYDIALVDAGGTLRTLRGVQYLYRLESADAYLVTVTGGADDADKFMPLAREIATSFVAVTP
jgi:hypothetical protein